MTFEEEADWRYTVHMGATWRIRLNDPCSAAMWSVYNDLFSPLGKLAKRAVYFAKLFLSLFFNGRLSRPGSSEPMDRSLPKFQDW